jgi:RNA polymerase sigma factor for flagellar operon FliA
MHRALATYAQERTDADRLIQQYGPLIDRIARRLVARIGLPSLYDDLWSAGALGLIEAAPRYDAGRGVTFEAFVAHRIRGAMLDELREMDHLPRRLRARSDDLERTRNRLQTQLGREADSAELAAELKMDVEEVEGLQALSEPPVPLESILPMLGGAADDVDQEIDRARALGLIAAAVETLPERLKILVSLHYVEGLSYREIAQIFDVSEPRICQLHGEAVAKLRSALREEGEEAEEADRPPSARRAL